MSIQIWKFDLAVHHEQFLLMPEGAKVLCVQIQNGFPKLWAECDTSRPGHSRSFLTLTTGEDFPAFVGEYIGTYQMGGGSFVAHVYEGK